ncbi:MAG: BamA/TamA family outer membrane protein [Vicinamibacterales bacterium]|jgi:outer membrane protein insertion porin family|nr:BamA/TamA family outer membrane protein [Vicinamibacterales bacterium]MDP6608667.1 BamA/TamA family outer membrane protein [Vicinamibacterales bacterium]|tara:strand:- start:7793 stop:10756 length:2964 start_codon:yes stop_codon:yes gene_type:complete
MVLFERSPGAAGRRPRGATRLVALILTVWAGQATPVAAAVQDYLGLPIVEVSLDFGGAVPPLGVEDLVVTRVGATLSMAGVRDSIWHLFSLARFSDIRVDASRRDGGVALRYELVPVRVVDEIAFSGDLGVSRGRLRDAIAERYGDRPPLDTMADAVDLLDNIYTDRGYLNARIEVTPREREGGLTTLAIEVAAGERARLAAVTVEGPALEPAAEVLRQLDLRSGGYYDREAVQRRLAEYASTLRDQGYYEATLGHTVAARGRGLRIDLAVQIDSGPRVTVEFQGDPLPGEIRDELVPVAREGSADEDLLEDSSRRIEDYLRQLGFRRAVATHTRASADQALRIVYQVERGPLVRVGAVELEGHEAFPRAVLEERLGIAVGDPFVEDTFAAGVAAVVAAYRAAGYPDARVATQVVEEPGVSGAGPAVRVRLTVAEGVLMLIGSLTIEGAPDAAAAALEATLEARAGNAYVRAVALADRDAILGQLLSLGYESAAVRVDATFDTESRRADLIYVVESGPQILVDHILITGEFSVSPDTIRRELTLAPGQPLSRDQIAESQRRLSALGLFRRIRFTEVNHVSDTRRDVLVTVEEGPSTTLSYGGGFEAGTRLRRSGGEDNIAVEKIDFAPRGFFEIGRRNLWGKNRSINLFTRVSLRPATDEDDPDGFGFNEYRALLAFQEPRAFGTAAELVVSAFIDQSIRSSFNLRQRGVRAELRRALTPTTSVSAGYSLNEDRRFDEQINPQDQALIDRLFPGVRLSTGSGTLIRDSRNDPFEPVGGGLLSVDADIAGRAIGSEVGFAKTLMQGFLYRRVPGSPALIFATGLRVGLATGFARTVIVTDEDDRSILDPEGQPNATVVKDLPASERFFAGGSTTVRGFALDRLGDERTIDQDGFPKGGNGMIIINNELRFPVWGGVGAVAFLDLGNVFTRVSDMRLGGLRGGAGFGVRYQSPIGPIRVDLGFKLDRQEFDNGTREGLTALHVSIGQAF